MSFQEQFSAWLDNALRDGVPDSVKAFSFNLDEPASINDVKFGVELIGASEFDEDDPDWACEEVWEPVQRRLNIPLSFSGESWEACMAAVRSLIQATLDADGAAAQVLKSRQAVAVGFVDGDLQVIWP